MIKRFLVDGDDFKKELKKLSIILILVLFTVGFGNLGWVYPLNDLNTPLTMFSVNNPYIIHDRWFNANKFMYDNCFLTEWYSWAFIGYFILNIMLAFIIVKLKNKDQEFIVRFEKKLTKYANFLHFLDSMGPTTSFCFIASFFIFNWAYFLLHISFIFVVLLGAYIFSSLLLIIIFMIKNINTRFNYYQIIDLFIINFSYKKQHKYLLSKTKKENVSDVSLVALAFTIYLGFANNFDFINSSPNNMMFNDKMHSFAFWFQIIFSSITFNLFVTDKPFNSGFSKLIISEATYSVKPGLQTGILNWIGFFTKPFNGFINCLTYKIVNH